MTALSSLGDTLENVHDSNLRNKCHSQGWVEKEQADFSVEMEHGLLIRKIL